MTTAELVQAIEEHARKASAYAARETIYDRDTARTHAEVAQALATALRVKAWYEGGVPW